MLGVDTASRSPPRESPLPPRGTARSPLELLPLPRVRPCDCSFDRRGASNEDHVAGVEELPPVGPVFQTVASPALDPDEPDEEDDEDPPASPPRETAPPPLSPRGTAVPVVLPFDVRSWAAAAVSPLRANATVSAAMELLFMTPPDVRCRRTTNRDSSNSTATRNDENPACSDHITPFHRGIVHS